MTFTEPLKNRWPLIGAVLAGLTLTASFILSAGFHIYRASSLTLWVGLALLATLCGTKGRVGALASFGLFYLVQVVLSTTTKFSWQADGVLGLPTHFQLLLLGASILGGHLLTRKMMVWGEKGNEVIYKTIGIEMRVRPAAKNGEGPSEEVGDDADDEDAECGVGGNTRVVVPAISKSPLPSEPGYVDRGRFPD